MFLGSHLSECANKDGKYHRKVDFDRLGKSCVLTGHSHWIGALLLLPLVHTTVVASMVSGLHPRMWLFSLTNVRTSSTYHFLLGNQMTVGLQNLHFVIT